MKYLTVYFTVVLAVIGLVADVSAAVWRVYPGGGGDAASIAEAVSLAADGDSIVVGCGTYFEHGIAINAAITIVSEDSSPGCATINGQRRDGIFSVDNVVGNVTFQGLTLLNGGNGGGGGGIYTVNSEVSITDCAFLFCDGNPGAGLLCHASALSVSNSTFSDCTSSGRGGAAYIVNSASVILTDCEFVRNSADDGGAISIRDSSPLFFDCVFSENNAGDGGAVYVDAGSGAQPYPDFTRCQFINNTGGNGGGAVYSASSYPSFFSCVVAANHGNYGGAFQFRGGTPTVHATTIAHNTGAQVGGIYNTGGSILLISNTIIAFNDGAAVSCSGGPTPSVVCTDVFGNGGDWGGCLAGLLGVYGNISEDPQFCDPTLLDYTVDAASPCLGSQCGQMGALGQGCSSPVAVHESTWGQIKAIYSN